MLRDWLELIRVPNVFTAMADVAMGFFLVVPVAAFGATSAIQLGLLIVASSLLYSAGMVLNDVYDYDEDCRDRPGRPLPSGRIDLAVARRVGFGMLATGWAAGAAVTCITGQWTAAICASGLAVFIVNYNVAWKKHAVAGPVALGLCRAANVLLGASAAAEWQPGQLQVAGAIGLFIVGVSVMARRETEDDDAAKPLRRSVAIGVVLMIVAVGSLAWLPCWRPILVQTTYWHGVIALMEVAVVWRCWRVLAEPSPANVQQAVGQSIRSLVVLDALITAAVAGLAPGIGVLLLLAPSLALSRRFYST